MATPNPAAFEQAVRAYLADAADQFNYEQLLHTFLSTERFHRWTQVAGGYRPVAGARVLASGCGFGGSLLAWRDAGAALAVGVEVDDDYLRFSRMRIAGRSGLAVVGYDGQRLPFADDAFDLIESIDVVEHAPDVHAYLGELRRVLAPGGLILLATPNRLWPVEQHLGILGPPWLPVGLADALFDALARLPLLGGDRRFRYSRLRGMRTANVSLRRLRGTAHDLGLFLRLVQPGAHEHDWPLPRDPAVVEWLARRRLGKYLAPTRTLVATLEHAAERG